MITTEIIMLLNFSSAFETADELKAYTFQLLRNLYRRVVHVDSALFACNRLTPVLTEHMKQMNSVSYDVQSGQNVRAFQVSPIK